jgi:hypothetical protein
VTDPLFHRDGDHLVAGPLARGPWDPDACHAGAPAALLAATVEAIPTLVPMQVARLSYEIQRPVPLGVPLALHTTVTREGKRIQGTEVVLTTAGPDATELVRCRALRIRTATLELPEARPTAPPAPTTGPKDLQRFGGRDDWDLGGFWEAVDVRFVSGDLGEPGEGTAWFRLLAPIAEELDVPAIARAAAAADFGNGIGAPLPMGPYRYVNPDLTVDLHRLPVGEWVAMRSTSIADTAGVGLTTSQLSDERGGIGTALQSLFIDVG